ncbi:putative indole-diterpene biosynthesis protein [Rhypophila decipiens]
MAAKTNNPLSFMHKLSNSVFLYRATESGPSSEPAQAPASNPDTSAPQVILLLGWMDARDAHLGWYVQKYRELYPLASIVLIKARTKGLASSSVGRQDAEPAIAPLRALLGDDEGSEPRLLIHALSGGGSSLLYHLYDLYDPGLPRHVTIFDSTPGVWTWSFASNLFTAGLRPGLAKTLIATPLGHLVAVVSWLLIKVLGVVPDGQRAWSAAHNNAAKNREACRAYIYSDEDKMVSPGTIGDHADDAVGKGFVVVRRELFAGSSHVAHARADPERYWRVVMQTYTAGASL